MLNNLWGYMPTLIFKYIEFVFHILERGFNSSSMSRGKEHNYDWPDCVMLAVAEAIRGKCKKHDYSSDPHLHSKLLSQLDLTLNPGEIGEAGVTEGCTVESFNQMMLKIRGDKKMVIFNVLVKPIEITPCGVGIEDQYDFEKEYVLVDFGNPSHCMYVVGKTWKDIDSKGNQLPCFLCNDDLKGNKTGKREQRWQRVPIYKINNKLYEVTIYPKESRTKDQAKRIYE